MSKIYMKAPYGKWYILMSRGGSAYWQYAVTRENIPEEGNWEKWSTEEVCVQLSLGTIPVEFSTEVVFHEDLMYMNFKVDPERVEIWVEKCREL